MFSTFEEVNKYLETLIPRKYKSTEALKLERIQYLLGLLGNPHKKFKSIHIGGTSGKGSVAYILSQLLAGQGLKTGLHISPHLQTIRERMQINGDLISEMEFVNLVNEIKPLVEKTETSLGLKKPSYFETTVALAFKHFADNKVDIAVVEVGLGGRLDATNVINPILSIITNVDLDHTDILGNTVEEIAKEKAGIIKKGVPVVSGIERLAVKNIIANKAGENGSKIYFINEEFNFKINKVDFSGVDFNFSWLNTNFSNLKIPIPAIYQVENASLALAAIQLLKETDFKLNDKKIYESLSKSKVPGRFEIISPGPRLTVGQDRTGQNDPLIILDGAHNPAKVKALLYSLHKLIPKGKYIFLIAFKKDKNISEMLQILSRHAETFVITEFNKTTDMGRKFTSPTKDIDKVLTEMNYSGKICIEKNSAKAFQKAKKLSSEKNPLVVTGSLYLIGETRDILFPINK